MSDTAVVYTIVGKDQASGVFGKIGNAAGAMFGAFAVGKIKDLAMDAIESASDLAETQSKVNVLFGQGAGALNAWAATADKAFGQSQQQALDAAATFATFGKSAGLAGPALNDFSTKLVGLSSDMASFSNTTPQEAIEAIGAALRGESEPIRKYGVLLDDASLKAKALQMGLAKGTSSTADITKAQVSATSALHAYNKAVADHGKNSLEAQKASVALTSAQDKLKSVTEGTISVLTPQQRVLAAQALIMDQTSAAQGDFARTSSGLANQQRIMAAEFDNAKTKLGTGLLPIMQKFMTGLMATIGFVQANKEWVTPLAIGIGVLAAGVWAVTAAQTAWNIAMALNPIGLIIIAVVGLVAAFIYLWTHSAAFRNFFIQLWQDIWGFLKAVGAWFAGPFAGFFVDAWHVISGAALWVWHNVLDPLWQAWKTGFDFVSNIVRSFINLWAAFAAWFFGTIYQGLIKPTLEGIGATFRWLWGNVLVPVGQAMRVTIAAVGAVFSWLWQNAIRPAWDGIVGVINWAWNNVMRPVFGAVEGAVHRVGDVFRSVFGAIGGFISGAFSGAVGIVRGAINSLIGLVNSAVGFINNNVINNANRIPGVNFPHLPQIPYLYAGGTIAAAGLAMVGERGPELVHLPTGATVYPHGTGPGGRVVELRVAAAADSKLATFLHGLQRDGILQFAMVD